MFATIISAPERFDRVDRVKETTGTEPLPLDHEVWITGDTLRFAVDGTQHCVPRGFVTDGSSIPRIGQLLARRSRWEPPLRWPAVAHDWLYTQPGVAKVYADLALRSLLRSTGASPWESAVLYGAARSFGGSAWAADQQAGPMIYDANAEAA